MLRNGTSGYVECPRAERDAANRPAHLGDGGQRLPRAGVTNFRLRHWDAVDVTLRGLPHEGINRRVVARECAQLRNLYNVRHSGYGFCRDSAVGKRRQDSTILKGYCERLACAPFE